MSTTENLQEAFAGESQANRRYLAFAKQAESDGLPQIARLFRAVAEAETIHAHSHLRVLGEVKGTSENVQTAIDGESHEFKTMYPEFLKTAQEEGNKRAEISFKHALAVEETHHGLYTDALEAAKAGNDLPEAAVYVCPICGHTEIGGAPDRCPVCGAAQDKFFSVA